MVKADITLSGSFAQTYRGHGTDKALIAGIMGMATDDSRIRRAPELAREQGLEVSITTGDIDGAIQYGQGHPDRRYRQHSLSFGKQHRRRQYTCQGSQRHGVSITGQHTTLIVLHRDAPGTIAAVTGGHGRRRGEYLQLPSVQAEPGRRGRDDH